MEKEEAQNMKKVEAYWSFSLDVTCPFCNEEFNMDDMDGFSYVEESGLNILEHDTKNSTDIEIYCPFCNNNFLVDCAY